MTYNKGGVLVKRSQKAHLVYPLKSIREPSHRKIIPINIKEQKSKENYED